jgi:hypothetical protein
MGIQPKYLNNNVYRAFRYLFSIFWVRLNYFLMKSSMKQSVVYLECEFTGNYRWGVILKDLTRPGSKQFLAM